MNQKPHVPAWLSGEGYPVIFGDGVMNGCNQRQSTMLQGENAIRNCLVIMNDIELRFPPHKPLLNPLPKGEWLSETACQLAEPLYAL
jgi:hypothetical protein